LNALTKGLAISHPRPLAIVRIGDVQTGILGAARDFRADLIVIGAQRSGVTAKDDDGLVEVIVRNAPCPVLVVRKQNFVTKRMAAVMMRRLQGTRRHLLKNLINLMPQSRT